MISIIALGENWKAYPSGFQKKLDDLKDACMILNLAYDQDAFHWHDENLAFTYWDSNSRCEISTSLLPYVTITLKILLNFMRICD